MPLSVRNPAGNIGSVSPPSWQRSPFSQTSFCFVCASVALAMSAPVKAARPGKRLKHWPTAASALWLWAGCRDQCHGCLLAHLHCLGTVCKCQDPFSPSRGSPVMSHPSQSLPLPHIWGRSHLITNSIPVNPGLHIDTQSITTSIAIPVFPFES